MKNSAIEPVVTQHAEEAAFLWLLRDAAVHAPHYTLKHLAKLDDRVEAHLDGLRIAGEAGWEICAEQLKYRESGEVFAAGVLAAENGDPRRLEPVLAVVEAVPETERALVSALGWVDPEAFGGMVRMLLDGATSRLRRLGIAACAIHRIDPGSDLDEAFSDDDPRLRARAARAAGELGRCDLLPALRACDEDDDESCRFWALWSSVLLGERGVALEFLKAEAVVRGPFQARALQLALRAMDEAGAQAWLKGLPRRPGSLRSVIVGAGVAGGPRYLPWLVRQMAAPETARVAGEAFALITGVDLAVRDLEGARPDGFEAGPTEDPEDEDVALDADEDLSWPDPERVRDWLEAKRTRFKAGTRYLLGEPITGPRCRRILATGLQRQREAAALELAVMKPGTPLFETRAPGFRQQQVLAKAAPAA